MRKGAKVGFNDPGIRKELDNAMDENKIFGKKC